MNKIRPIVLCIFLSMISLTQLQANSNHVCEAQRAEYPSIWNDTQYETTIMKCFGKSIGLEIRMSPRYMRFMDYQYEVAVRNLSIIDDKGTVYRNIMIEQDLIDLMSHGRILRIMLRTATSCTINGRTSDSGYLIVSKNQGGLINFNNKVDILTNCIEI
ncbi:MAG: hypothetical protein ISR65_08560 [Bacteriovoracaceae bacterium]|nr:hypothetical protein [Bacteriovoracaceae bacterium]